MYLGQQHAPTRSALRAQRGFPPGIIGAAFQKRGFSGATPRCYPHGAHHSGGREAANLMCMVDSWARARLEAESRMRTHEGRAIHVCMVCLRPVPALALITAAVRVLLSLVLTLRVLVPSPDQPAASPSEVPFLHPAVPFCIQCRLHIGQGLASACWCCERHVCGEDCDSNGDGGGRRESSSSICRTRSDSNGEG